jgi:uncharacterized protein (DUF697 family)
VLAAVRGLRTGERGGTIVIDGAPKLVPLLARDLRAGGNPAAVREGSVDTGTQSVLIWVGEPDEDALRAASVARVPIVAVTEAEHVPYVLETDLVRVPAGQGFPVEQIAVAVARRLGDRGPALAAELPVLRDAVVDDLIRGAARRNAVLAAGIFVPGVDMPVLTLSQIRLVMRIAEAYGLEVGRERALEVLGVVGAGFGFRTVAREALDLVPVAGWALKGAVAYGGTRAVGEAARRFFAEGAVRSGS